MSLCVDCRHSKILDKYSRTVYRVCQKLTPKEHQTDAFTPRWTLCMNAKETGCENGKLWESK